MQLQPLKPPPIMDAITQPQSNRQSPMTASLQRTHSQPCPSLKQSITLIQTTLPATLPISSPHASPSDSPTTVHMPAAPSATADKPSWLNSSLTLLEESSKAECLQQWNDFYSEFIQSHKDFYCKDTTALTTSADDNNNESIPTQSWSTQQFSSNIAPPPIHTHEWHGFYNEFSQSNRNYQNEPQQLYSQ